MTLPVVKRHYPIVEVLWEDAALFAGWEAPEYATGWVKESHDVLSVGYLFERNRQRIVLVQSVSRGKNVNGQFKIPLAMVKRVRVLAKAER